MSVVAPLSRRCAASVRPNALASLRAAPPRTPARFAQRRTLFTSNPGNKGTWKGFALRWGLAAAAVYWYNTSPVFADEPPPQTILAPTPFQDSDVQTIDSIIEEKRKALKPTADSAVVLAPEDAEELPAEGPPEITPPVPGSPEALEEEAEGQGAFNPETGEINWDCPCLGGMAHGPCGEEFKAAFSCFVYSDVEPKGSDCIDKFVDMQRCFRKYPEVYGDDMQDGDDGDVPEGADGAEGGAAPPEVAASSDGAGADEKASGPVQVAMQNASSATVDKVPSKEQLEEAMPANREAVASPNKD